MSVVIIALLSLLVVVMGIMCGILIRVMRAVKDTAGRVCSIQEGLKSRVGSSLVGGLRGVKSEVVSPNYREWAEREDSI